MTEPVRLVIWDLDETFWKGTLSEGGIQQYIENHHNIVIELARRGIMSSICSKNNLSDVEAIFKKNGLWDYFILPSIDWRPKGVRIAEIAEMVQLRPPTILFIDDNPQNRAEATDAVPGIQVSDESCIDGLLKDNRFKGKDDAKLTRLTQYKLLERKKSDEAASGGDNSDFLRSCNIRVSIEYNVEDYIERAVELVNRTNQLNFTKRRLPEDIDEACSELRKELRFFGHQAGLIKVLDNYGDYGFCGFYLKHNDSKFGIGQLLHYCFSCRILGMGVEKWLYQKILNSPPIGIVGEVVTDIRQTDKSDWINLQFLDEREEVGSKHEVAHTEIRFRGGCEIAALAHYFRMSCDVTCMETTFKRDIFLMRYDCSSMMVNSLMKDEEILRSAAILEIPRTEMQCRLFIESSRDTAIIMSTWGDIFSPTHRHRTLHAYINITIPGIMSETGSHRSGDFSNWTSEYLSTRIRELEVGIEIQNRLSTVVQELRENYEFVGLYDPNIIQANHEYIFDHVPVGTTLYVVLPDPLGGRNNCKVPRPRVMTYTSAVERAAEGRANIVLIAIADCIHSPEDRDDIGDHYHRIVYFRLAEKIKSVMRTRTGTQSVAHQVN